VEKPGTVLLTRSPVDVCGCYGAGEAERQPLRAAGESRFFVGTAIARMVFLSDHALVLTRLRLTLLIVGFGS